MPLLIVSDRLPRGGPASVTERPAILCDHCNREITRWDDGCYWYPPPENDCGAVFLRFVHEDCTTAFLRADPRRERWLTMELENLFVYLSYALDLDFEERARIRALIRERLGVDRGD
jgi:hypothetical protein